MEWVAQIQCRLLFICAKSWRPSASARERGTCLGPAGSTWARWKKFMLGTLPDFYLSERALENWLKVLCTGGWFLVIGGEGGLVCFLVWVLTANRLKLGSKPSLACVEKYLASQVIFFLAKLCLLCMSQKELCTLRSAASHLKWGFWCSEPLSWCVLAQGEKSGLWCVMADPCPLFSHGCCGISGTGEAAHTSYAIQNITSGIRPCVIWVHVSSLIINFREKIFLTRCCLTLEESSWSE